MLSLRMRLMATVLACLIGLPVGVLVAIGRFRGRGAVLIVMNAHCKLDLLSVELAFRPTLEDRSMVQRRRVSGWASLVAQHMSPSF